MGKKDSNLHYLEAFLRIAPLKLFKSDFKSPQYPYKRQLTAHYY